MKLKKWFSVPMEELRVQDPESRMTSTGFMLVGEEYTDDQGRVVRIRPPYAQIGIPYADLISEQEQLEFLVGLLGLNEDTIQTL